MMRTLHKMLRTLHSVRGSCLLRQESLDIPRNIYFASVPETIGLICADISLTGQKTKLWLINELHRKFSVSIQGLNTNLFYVERMVEPQEGGCGPNVTIQ
jgi:hypothetical protein